MPDFYEQVYRVGTPRTTKADVVEYYAQRYEWNKGGEAQLIRDFFPYTTLKEPRYLQRRFNPSRLTNVPRTERERQEYREFGKTLPAKAPAGGYQFSGTVCVVYSPEGRHPDERTLKIDTRLAVISGEQAKIFATLTEFEVLQGFINFYQNGDVETRGPSPCEDEDGSGLIVERGEGEEEDEEESA